MVKHVKKYKSKALEGKGSLSPRARVGNTIGRRELDLQNGGRN